MVYTLTLNPALDLIVGVDDFKEGLVNRTSYEKVLSGGKGINVSIVLKNLGVESTVLGFLAGFSGAVIEKDLKEFGVATNFLYLENGFSRINVKIKSQAETEINSKGPKISDCDLKKLYKKLDILADGDFLVLAGSVPLGAPKSIYADIMEYLKDKKINIIVDTSGDGLVKTLKYKPFLIKPNNFELGEIFDEEIKTKEDAACFAKKLLAMGAKNVIVSLGGAGALLVSENDEVIYVKAPDGEVINTTGAGDSLVAGFIAGLLENGDFDYALRLGVASGSASAFSKNLASGEEIRGIFEKNL